MQAHQNAAMRTTIDLPESLHSVATSLARHTGRSFSATVAALMERGLASQEQASQVAPHPIRIDSLTGLPVLRSRRPVTPDDVAALEDEA
jgi:hypothetical protein